MYIQLMAVFIFTFHAYRSWAEDNRRGYVQRGRPGVQAPSENLARHRAAIATHKPVRFDAAQQVIIIEEIQRVCDSENWRVHGISVTPTHIHIVVSWRQRTPPDKLVARLKQMIGRALSVHARSAGNRWLSRGCDKTRIEDRAHLNYLLTEYLPSHEQHRGTVWIEGAGGE